ncbi:MAG: DUF2339 domain-containing protein [Chitinophagaceae bacterium]|nr:DUF2339 domain-containing protein [Chitinophagaceae bacterium]
MNSIEEKIALLTVRIQDLASQQNVFKAKLLELMRELELLKAQAAKEGLPATQEVTTPQSGTEQPISTAADLLPPKPVVTATPVETEKPVEQATFTAPPKPVRDPEAGSSGNIEEFLGKNLASKVGILVTVIGIFIGAKYAIEHNLISETVRIIFGYLAGAVLIGLGFRFRNKYPAYSAVLMGGGLCVAYFITYIAFTYYQMFPRMMAFGIMVAVTGGTVYASLLYNRVIIAHLAQVGAYAIPFLLSDNSGNYTALFSYIAIINAGMVIISLKKYWKSLLYAAFGITWFIYIFWFVGVSDEANFKQVAWFFLSLFFGLFYTSLLTYKLIKKEEFHFGDVLLVIPNAFIFFGIGLHLLQKAGWSDWAQGGFTVFNALIHGGIALLVNRIIGKDNPLFGLLIGLVISFLVIAVPVAFNGNAIILLWAAEALMLYVLGMQWRSNLFLSFSMVMVTLSLFGAVVQTASDYYQYSNSTGTPVRPEAFLNRTFLTAVLVLGSDCLLIWLDRNRYRHPETNKSTFRFVFFDVLFPAAVIAVSFFIFYMELSHWFDNISDTMKGADGSFDPWAREVGMAKLTGLLLYSFVFTTILVAMNHRWFHSKAIKVTGFGFFMLLLIFWAAFFLRMMNLQAINYFGKGQTGLYFGIWNWLDRYCMLIPIAALMYYFQPKFTSEENRYQMKLLWPQLVVIMLILFLSFEYLLWTSVSGANNQYRYGLSILWGLYALALIAFGIWKKHKGIRFSAMIMLVITLLKVTILDLSHANTLTRTISYIVLGGILLLISYLYNRYKDLLFGNDESA